MQYFFLLGGFIGFLLPCAIGVLTGQEPGGVLLRAGVGCLGGAYLMRGFWMLIARCLRNSMVEKSRLQSTGSVSR
jgi:hypothetical protein